MSTLKALVCPLLLLLAVSAISQPVTTTYTPNGYNYPDVRVTADYTKLPHGSWYYTFCTIVHNPNTQSDYVMYALDDSLRPVYTQKLAPYSQSWAGLSTYWQKNDSLLGYVRNLSIDTTIWGVYPRLKTDINKRGLVAHDTLTGASTIYRPSVKLLDLHGLYLSDSFYVTMQDHIYVGDTGFSVSMKSYDKDSVIAQWSTEDATEGIPDSQSYQKLCIGYQINLSNIDYFHPNSIDAVGDSMFIISMRHQNELCCLKYERATNSFKLAWRLRPPNDPFSSFKWKGDGIGFKGQHNGVVVFANEKDWYLSVFDDAECDTLKSSRFMLLQLNFDSMTCTVVRKTNLGFRTRAQGSSMLVTQAADTSDFQTAPILYSSGIFDTTGIQQTGLDVIGLMDAQGEKIGSVNFQPGIIKNYSQVWSHTYQARPYYIPLFDEIRPKLVVACGTDSMTISLTEHYDNVNWSTGQSSQSITLPRVQTPISVAVNNNTTVGEWWAYTNGCPALSDVNDIANAWVAIYPNPAHNYINIIADITEKTEYVVTDINGRAVQYGYLYNGGNQQLNMTLPQGTYLLTLKTANKIYNKRFVIV